MTKSQQPTTDPTRISFRLDPEIATELARRAEEAGMSRGQYARDLVCASLLQRDEQHQDLRIIRVELSRLAKVLDLIRGVRSDLASSVRILLVNAGKLQPDQAHRWVEQTLLPKELTEET
jgi:hypothetical protein